MKAGDVVRMVAVTDKPAFAGDDDDPWLCSLIGRCGTVTAVHDDRVQLLGLSRPEDDDEGEQFGGGWYIPIRNVRKVWRVALWIQQRRDSIRVQP